MKAVIFFIGFFLIGLFIVTCKWYSCKRESVSNKNDDISVVGKKKHSHNINLILFISFLILSIGTMCLLHGVYTCLESAHHTILSVFSASDTLSILIGIFTAVTACAIFVIQENSSEEESNRTVIYRNEVKNHFSDLFNADKLVKQDENLHKVTEMWSKVTYLNINIMRDSNNLFVDMVLPAYVLSQNEFCGMSIIDKENEYGVVNGNLVQDESIYALHYCIENNNDQAHLIKIISDSVSGKNKTLFLTFRSAKCTHLHTLKERANLYPNEDDYDILTYDVKIEVNVGKVFVGISQIQMHDCLVRLLSCDYNLQSGVGEQS